MLFVHQSCDFLCPESLTKFDFSSQLCEFDPKYLLQAVSDVKCITLQGLQA